MPEISASGLSVADVTALIAAQVPGLLPTTFVGGGAYMTIDQLLTTYPAGAAYDGMYANISNLFNGTSTTGAGGVKEVLRCRRDISNGLYAWTIQREAYNNTAAAATGSLTLLPLITPPTLRLTGTLTGNLNVQPSSVNAYIGLRQRVIQNSTLGLFATTITGLIGSNITLLGNTVQDLEFTNTGWAKAST